MNSQIPQPVDIDALDKEERKRLANFYGAVQCMGTLEPPGDLRSLSYDEWKDLLIECEYAVNKHCIKNEKGAEKVRIMKDILGRIS